MSVVSFLPADFSHTPSRILGPVWRRAEIVRRRIRRGLREDRGYDDRAHWRTAENVPGGDASDESAGCAMSPRQRCKASEGQGNAVRVLRYCHQQRNQQGWQRPDNLASANPEQVAAEPGSRQRLRQEARLPLQPPFLSCSKVPSARFVPKPCPTPVRVRPRWARVWPAQARWRHMSQAIHQGRERY